MEAEPKIDQDQAGCRRSTIKFRGVSISNRDAPTVCCVQHLQRLADLAGRNTTASGLAHRILETVGGQAPAGGKYSSARYK